MQKRAQNAFEMAKALFRRHGGILRSGDAIRAGVHPRTLYAMRDAGVLERLNRGLYRLTELPPVDNLDLVSVAMKVPGGVICLISALAFHQITTQIPHEVYIALERGAEPPRLEHPPVRVFWFAREAFSQGVETHKVNGATVHIYSPEKTLADCFKYRNKIGLDTAIEALKLYRQHKRVRVDDLLRFAQICRVEKIMRPYLESLL